MIHELEILSKYFVPIQNGTKNFEIREIRDRVFKVGDTLMLFEIDDITRRPTGRHIEKEITYTLDDERFCKSGYIVMGLK